MRNLFKKRFYLKIFSFILLLSFIGTLVLSKSNNLALTPLLPISFEMNSFEIVDADGITLSGNTITYSNQQGNCAVIPLPYEIDLSKFGTMIISGSASTEFRHSYLDGDKNNLMGEDQFYNNNSFNEKFSHYISAKGVAKYLILESTNTEGLVLKIDSIKFLEKVEVPETIMITRTKKEVGNNNPITLQRFTADPYAIEYKGRVYVYGTNDSEALRFDEDAKFMENDHDLIKSINCYSSADMVNWTDHGIINIAGKSGDGSALWAVNSMAPAVAYKKIDGKDKFFIYFVNSENSIGVLTGDSPTGPWSDPIGKPLINQSITPNISDTKLFDPAVLVEDDGSAYIYFGGGISENTPLEAPETARVMKLGADMISLEGEPVLIDAPYFSGDSGINKIGDTYYYSYCTNESTWLDHNGKLVGDCEIAYMTSKNPMGPYEYQSSILQNPEKFFSVSGGNHHCMLKFKNEWYIFYHTQKYRVDMDMPVGYRTTYVDKIKVNHDGSITPGEMTHKGVGLVGNPDPYVNNEAESFAWTEGSSTIRSLYGAFNRSLISYGGWIGVAGVDFGEGGAEKLNIRVAATRDGGVLKVYLDNKTTGTLIGVTGIPNTNNQIYPGSYSYTDIKINLSAKFKGIHNLFFVFEGGDIKMDSWKFLKSDKEEPVSKKLPVSSVNIKKKLTMKMGNKSRLKATVMPLNATNQKVTWKSSKSSIVAVDKKGGVTAKKPGKAMITVTTADGKKKDTCIVTVRKPTIKLNYSTLKIRAWKGVKTVRILSSKPFGEKIKFAKSSKRSVVSVLVKNGRITISGKKKGKAVITVTSTNNGKGKIRITVRK